MKKTYNVEVDCPNCAAKMEEAVKKCVEDLQNGSYNCDVQNNLSARQRTGTISRKDYWEMFPDCREAFFSEITVLS